MATSASSGLDIYRAAHELINQHGDMAPVEAAMRADEMLEKGDVDAHWPTSSIRKLSLLAPCQAIGRSCEVF